MIVFKEFKKKIEEKNDWYKCLSLIASELRMDMDMDRWMVGNQ